MKYAEGSYDGNREIAVFWAIWHHVRHSDQTLPQTINQAANWEKRVVIGGDAYDIMADSGVFDE